MTEFRRLLDDPGEDELALALLRAARDEEPDTTSLLGAATALGVGAAFAAATTTTNALAAVAAGHTATAGALAASTSPLATSAGALATSGGALGTAASSAASAPLLALLAKPLAFGLVTGLAAVGGLSYVADGSSPVSAAPPAVADDRPVTSPRTPARDSAKALLMVPPGAHLPSESGSIADVEAPRNPPPARALARVEAPVPRLAEPALPTHVQPPSQPTAAFAVEPAAAPPPPVPVAKAPAPASALTRELAVEVALLDRARGALGRRDASAALSALDEYSSVRRSGNFDPEATVLRIRALVGLGERAGAARLARGFLAKYPESGHTPWLRSLSE